MYMSLFGLAVSVLLFILCLLVKIKFIKRLRFSMYISWSWSSVVLLYHLVVVVSVPTAGACKNVGLLYPLFCCLSAYGSLLMKLGLTIQGLK